MGLQAHFLLEISAACETQRLRGFLSAVNVGNLNSGSGLFGYQRVHTGEGALWMQLMRRAEKAMAQYSCLEDPMDGGAWWAAVHGVAKSRTRLNDFTFTFHFHALEKEMATHSSVLAWRIPGTGEPGGLLSVGSHRVRHDWSDLAAAQVSGKLCYNQCEIHLSLSFPPSLFSFSSNLSISSRDIPTLHAEPKLKVLPGSIAFLPWLSLSFHDLLPSSLFLILRPKTMMVFPCCLSDESKRIILGQKSYISRSRDFAARLVKDSAQCLAYHTCWVKVRCLLPLLFLLALVSGEAATCDNQGQFQEKAWANQPGKGESFKDVEMMTSQRLWRCQRVRNKLIGFESKEFGVDLWGGCFSWVWRETHVQVLRSEQVIRKQDAKDGISL